MTAPGMATCTSRIALSIASLADIAGRVNSSASLPAVPAPTSASSHPASASFSSSVSMGAGVSGSSNRKVKQYSVMLMPSLAFFYLTTVIYDAPQCFCMVRRAFWCVPDTGQTKFPTPACLKI